MPLLGQLISGLFGSLVAFLSRFLAVQVAVKSAAVTALFGFVGVLMVAFNAAVAPFIAGMFTTQYGQVLGLAFPPIAGTCIAAISATWAGCALYALQRRAVGIVAA